MALLVFALLFALIPACTTPYQWTSYPEAAELDSLTADQWRADIEYLRIELPRRNPHFEQDESLAIAFDQTAAEIADGIGSTVSSDEMVVQISRLLATVGEGHTSINASPLTYLPMLVRWLADGLYVAGANREYEEMLGCRVAGIKRPDGVTIDLDRLEQILNPVISVDHPAGFRASHNSVMTNPRLMRGLGLADDSGLVYLIEQPDAPGTAEVLVTEHTPEELDIVRVYDDADTVPLSRTSQDPYWFVRTGTEFDVIYFRYDECTFDAFGLLRELRSELASDPPDRLIIDLRYNSGGNSIPGTWFARRLGRIESLANDGSIFVLIGPNTFSSGMMFAVDLMDRTAAIFAGSPLAESPNSWGEVKRFPLPNSQLMIGHSTKYFAYADGKDLRLDEDGVLVPDPGFEIVPDIEEYSAGRDVVLEVALTYR